jgi:hypothetical protein
MHSKKILVSMEMLVLSTLEFRYTQLLPTLLFFIFFTLFVPEV